MALKQLEELMVADPTVGSPEDRELVELARRINKYERDHIRIPKPTADEIHLFQRESLKKTLL
ncbi:MAG: hypothetical protein NTU84_09685 [Verrucomicrobia bacterium]|nr:hypothetical protein [Verrucomicrobiota bacterium]